MSKYKYFKEDILEATLDNGLKCVFIHLNTSDVIAKYGVRYGSDVLGKIDDKEIPLGSAHFLEHRIFDYDGINVMNEFEKYGAQCNAFTSNTHTVYEFHTNTNIKECLNLLLDFTQYIKFSDENFENEKDIIVNELLGYLDNPAYKASLILKQNTYFNNPRKNDIGGNEESVRNTTKQDLYRIHNYFYNPNNCVLVVGGNIDVNEIYQIVLENQSKKKFINKGVFKPFKYIENKQVVKKIDEVNLKTGSDLLYMSIKLDLKFDNLETYNKQSYIAQIYSSIMFDSISYLNQTNKDIIVGESFGGYINFDLLTNEGFIYSYTTNINKLEKNIKKAIKNYKKYINKEYFESIKNAKLASLYTISDNSDELVDTIVDNTLDGTNFFNDIDVFNSISYQDILDFGNIIANSSISVLKIHNK